MKELSKEDQERIEKAAHKMFFGISLQDGFKEGAEYEHPIAYNKGIEAVIKHIWGEGAIIKEIEKLKKTV